MRDIPTNQGLNSRSLPKKREQAVTELARLEHEKSRLERELEMWRENQKQTEARLEKVEERLASLRDMVEPAAGDETPKRTPARRRSAARATSQDEDDDADWHEISLEY